MSKRNYSQDIFDDNSLGSEAETSKKKNAGLLSTTSVAFKNTWKALYPIKLL